MIQQDDKSGLTIFHYRDLEMISGWDGFDIQGHVAPDKKGNMQEGVQEGMVGDITDEQNARGNVQSLRSIIFVCN